MPGVALGRRRLPEGWHHLEPKIETKIVRPPSHKQFDLFSSSVGGSHGVSTVEIDRGLFVDFFGRLFSSLCCCCSTQRSWYFRHSHVAPQKLRRKRKQKPNCDHSAGPRIFRLTKDIVTLRPDFTISRNDMPFPRNETLRALRAVENCNWAFGAKIHGMASVSDPAPAPAVCLVARLIGCRRRCYGSHATRARCHAPLHCRPL